MNRLLLLGILQFALAGSLLADSNLRITDVGLHGYAGAISAVRILVRNPSSQKQPIQLRLAATRQKGVTNVVTTDLVLNGGEQRELELPILGGPGTADVVADATAAGAVIGHDIHPGPALKEGLIVLMCANENICKAAQSQIQFSGTVEDRADKNRQTSFEIVSDPRGHWWAYSAASAIVLAMPTAELTSAQRDALEGFLRRGGYLVLVEREIGDRSFLSAYREGAAGPEGERVGDGLLFRVSDLGANALGNIFAGRNLPAFFARTLYTIMNSNRPGLLSRRFATAFDFPGLAWVLIWLATYIVIIGAVNFTVLRRLHHLEFGWISVCGLALLFAAGFYFFSAKRQPTNFVIDNLAIYFLDGRSPLAVADYDIRISAPARKDVIVSVADPAVFSPISLPPVKPNSQIWSEMNREGAEASQEYSVRFGPPSQVNLSLLKWSFQDLYLQGMRVFPGTVHMVAPNRLRNDTGQQFSEAVYLDRASNSLYVLPPITPGEEVQLDAITPKRIRTDNQSIVSFGANVDTRTQTLQDLALARELGFAGQGPVFAGISNGPALPVEMNVPHLENVHSLIVAYVGQP